MFPNLFRIYLKLTTMVTAIVLVAHILYEHLYLLSWKYISVKYPTDVSYIWFKNITKLHIQSNNLPQVRLNV